MVDSPRFGFAYLEEGEAVPSQAVNEALEMLESAGGHIIIEDRDATAPPGSPDPGDTYLVATGGTGAWATHDGEIAYFFNTAWRFYDVIEGLTFWVKDENVFIVALTSSTFAEFESTATGTYLPIADVDTDGTMAANSDAKVASQKAVRTYVAAAVTGLLDLKGSTDCSANPNYPAASKGDTYLVSVAGKIGGASGTEVEATDVYVALADNAGGTQAAVGTSWSVLQGNILAGGYTPGGTDVPIADGGTGASTAAGALVNLGAAPAVLTIEAETGTTYTFILADAGKHKRFTNASAVTVTVPPNSSVAFTVGTRIRNTAAGAGGTVLAPGAGVTLNSRGSALTSAGQYAVWEIEKVATDVWDVLGDLV